MQSLTSIKEELESTPRERIITEALTHPSYSNEHNLQYSNQRLEFLGDAILGAIITQHLYKSYANLQEGTLTKMKAHLISADWCSQIAMSIGLKEHLYLGKGLDPSNLPKAILADAMESLIGAFYLIYGYEATYREVLDIWNANSITAADDFHTNPKGALQEYCQKNCKSLQYKVEDLPNKLFKASVFIGGYFMGSGQGSSKKDAEMNAASVVLNFMSPNK